MGVYMKDTAWILRQMEKDFIFNTTDTKYYSYITIIIKVLRRMEVGSEARLRRRIFSFGNWSEGELLPKLVAWSGINKVRG